MSSEERKVKSNPKPLVFRHDQLVIVYDDLSPVADDLRVLGKNKYPDAEDKKWFTSLIDDFPRVISAIGKYRYHDHENGRRDVDLLPVPLSQWLAANRDQEPNGFNTPLFVAFVQFFYGHQDDAHDPIGAVFSSQSVTKTILQQAERVYTAHVHNVRPLGYNIQFDNVHLSAVCLSRWSISYRGEFGIQPRFTALINKVRNDPAPGEESYAPPFGTEFTHVHLSTTRALQDGPYRQEIVDDYLVRRIVGFAMFARTPDTVREHVWSTEAAALSSIVSHGLADPNTMWGHALTGHRLYDPRLFMLVWNIVTGDTLPNQDKRKRGDGGEDDDDD